MDDDSLSVGEGDYFLGYLGPDGEGIADVVALTEAEFDDFQERRLRVIRSSDRFTFPLLAENHRELVGKVDFTKLLISSRRAIGPVDERALDAVLTAQIVNWLTSARLFLDHAETEIKRRFGEDSTQWERFKAAKGAAFDGSVGYRFCYKFRNYVQHCGLPRPSLSSGLEPDDSVSVQITFERDQLLADYHEWGKAKADLEAMPSSFDVLPLIDDAMDGLTSVEIEVIRLDMEWAAEGVVPLWELLDRHRESFSHGRIPFLGHVVPAKDGTKNLNLTIAELHPAPINAMHDLAIGRRPVDDLIRDNRGVDHPLADPEFRRVFNPDNRGMAALAKWVNEGGQTEEYLRTVNAIVEADDSVSPLFNDLIELSALLLTMAAHGTGATVEGLLGSLAIQGVPVPDEDEHEGEDGRPDTGP